MAKRYDRYALSPGDDIGDPTVLNTVLRDIDNRLHTVEAQGAVIEEKADDLEAVALSRLNDVFTGALQTAQDRANEVGASFRAESATDVTVGLGEKTFTLTAATMGGFVASEYLIAVSAADPDQWMRGRRVSYNVVDGILVVDVDAVFGSGESAADWLIRPAAPGDAEHAARTDNPHGVTAGQVGTYPTAAVDQMVAAVIGTASGAFDTLGEAESRVLAAEADLLTKLPLSRPLFMGQRTGSTQTASGAFVVDNVWLDSASAYNTSNGRFTCPVSGYYEVHAHILLSNGPVNAWADMAVWKNGVLQGQQFAYSVLYRNEYRSLTGAAMVQATSGDYLEAYLTLNSGAVAFSGYNFLIFKQVA